LSLDFISGEIYIDKAAPAFAIFKFTQSIAAAAGFGYASFIPLYWHIGMLCCMGLIGSAIFVLIDIQTIKQDKLEKVNHIFAFVADYFHICTTIGCYRCCCCCW
jgi:hypothetical protein